MATPWIRVELTGIEPAFADLAQRLDDELDAAMEEIGHAVAERARREHAFANRTGDLERSIRSELFSTTRPLGGGLVSVLVIGDTEYGEYVEELHARRFAYLAPAWAREQAAAEHRLERALRLATDRSAAFLPR